MAKARDSPSDIKQAPQMSQDLGTEHQVDGQTTVCVCVCVCVFVCVCMCVYVYVCVCVCFCMS